MNNFSNLFDILLENYFDGSENTIIKETDLGNARELLERFYWFGLCNYSNYSQLVTEKKGLTCYEYMINKYEFFKDMLRDAFDMGKRVVIW